jgi:hypothetical protein
LDIYRERVAVRVAVGIRDEIRLDAGLLARREPVAPVENAASSSTIGCKSPRASSGTASGTILPGIETAGKQGVRHCLTNGGFLRERVESSSLGLYICGTISCKSLPDEGLCRSVQEHRYAVVVREGSDLWLTLWVRRSPKGEFFVMVPRGDGDWDPHTSYHRDGRLHMKSYDHKLGSPQKRQPLTGVFRGTEHLGISMGHDPKSVGVICEPTAFSGVVEVAPGVLGRHNGGVIVDLVEPGCVPMSVLNTIVRQEVFRDTLPWIVIRISS